MSKVAYRKSHITEYLDRMETQAIAAVKAEFQTMYDANFTEIVKKIPYFEDLVLATENSVITINAALDRLQETCDPFLKDERSYDAVLWSRFKRYSIYKELKNCTIDKDGVLSNLKEYARSREKEVKNTYAQVRSQINAITSPEKMRKYLDNLGFDTGMIDTLAGYIPPVNMEIDKKNLFPYKELQAPKDLEPITED